MPYRGVLDDVRAAIDRRPPARMPAFALSEEFDVRWHGRYSYEEVCQDGAKMAEVWIAAVEAFDYDWAWLQVDDCFEFEPLGVGTHGEGNILRATRDYLPAIRETLDRLPFPDPRRDGRMPAKLEAIGRVRRRFGDEVFVVGSCAAPYSSAGLLFGLEEAMLLGMSDPELLAATCDFFVGWQSRWIEAQVEAGAQAIWLGDCNAFSGMLSPEQYRRFAFPSCKALIDRAHRAGAWVYLHNSEVSVPYLEAEAEAGADLVNCGPAAAMPAVHQALAGKCAYSGNLDPIAVLLRGTPRQVADETRRLLALGAGRPGYLFNTGEMNPRDVPEDNMRAMIGAIKECSAA